MWPSNIPHTTAQRIFQFPSSSLSTITSVPRHPANPRAPLHHIFFFAFSFLVFFRIRHISTVRNNSTNPQFHVIRPFRSFHLIPRHYFSFLFFYLFFITTFFFHLVSGVPFPRFNGGVLLGPLHIVTSAPPVIVPNSHLCASRL